MRLVRVTSGLDKVQARMYTIVDDFSTVDAVLLIQVCIKAGFNILNDGLPVIEEHVSKKAHI